jgi:hypothetical protein
MYMSDVKTLQIGGRPYLVRPIRTEEENLISSYLSKFSKISSPAGVRTLRGGEHLHFGWDFLEPAYIELTDRDWRVYDPVTYRGFGLTLMIRDQGINVWLCHIRGLLEDGKKLRIWRGGDPQLRSAGFTTGSHWHVHFTPEGRADVYLLPAGLIESLTHRYVKK